MKSSHRFPLRRQIVWGMRFLPFLPLWPWARRCSFSPTNMCVPTPCRSAEFNLRLVATSIETSLESADALLKLGFH